MSDLLHDHLEHGIHDGCPACTQLAFDFARIRDGKPVPIAALREAGRIARGEPEPPVTYAVPALEADRQPA